MCKNKIPNYKSQMNAKKGSEISFGVEFTAYENNFNMLLILKVVGKE